MKDKTTPDIYEPMRRILRAYELRGKGLMRVLGCADGTASRRHKDPGTLTLEDMIVLCLSGGVPVTKMVNAVMETIEEASGGGTP